MVNSSGVARISVRGGHSAKNYLLVNFLNLYKIRTKIRNIYQNF